VPVKRSGRNPAADLLHKRQSVANAPVVCDLAVLDAHDIDGLEVDLTGPRNCGIQLGSIGLSTSLRE
jgi:hypothetical protein